jgi:glycosyltransferase involved in cell wall biosynthesis
VLEAVARRFTQVALPIFRPSVKSSLRVLVVAYSFPPVGGAGVQRVTKLVKYLAMHGVRPAVLTVANPSVPLYDASLERDLPPGLEVVRARTLEPSYAAKRAAWSAASTSPSPSPTTSPSPSPLATLKHRLLRAASSVARELLVPDAQVLWLPAAQRALASRLRARQDDALFISGPPFSQFLLEPLARLSPRVAVVLDYRDEWSTWRTTYEMTSRLAAVAGAQLERALVTRADAVTTATEEFRANLLARFSSLDPERVFAIPNGYDPEDFPSDLPSPPRGGPLHVTYAGTVFKLTSARGLLDAVRLLHARRPDLAGALRLRGDRAARRRAGRLPAARRGAAGARREPPHLVPARRRPRSRAHLSGQDLRAHGARPAGAHPRPPRCPRPPRRAARPREGRRAS